MNSAHATGIRKAVEAAMSTLTDSQLRHLTLEPYLEMRAQVALPHAA